LKWDIGALVMRSKLFSVSSTRGEDGLSLLQKLL
jgi:hypothetical protein